MRSSLLISALILAISANSGFAEAKDKQQGQVLNKSQAGQLALQQLGGKILKIQSHSNQGQHGYRVKLLQSSGHVKQVWVNANSGKIH